MSSSARATARQPMVFSQLCATGGDEAETLFQQAMDYETTRKGVEFDLYRAEKLYEQAIKKGNAKAPLFLARLYRHAYQEVPGYSPRLQFQLALIERSVRMGCPDALLYLAEVYQNGWGVKEDIPLAWKLVKEGAEKGALSAMAEWGVNMYFEYRFEKSANAEAKRAEGKMWLEKALKAGYGEAGYELATIFRMYELDMPNTIRVLREGSRLGNVNCLFMLANIYRRGDGGQKPDGAYADRVDAIRRQIDIKEDPRVIVSFDDLLPPKEVLPFPVQGGRND